MCTNFSQFLTTWRMYFFGFIGECLELFLPSRQICEISRRSDALKTHWWITRRPLYDYWHLCSWKKAVLS